MEQINYKRINTKDLWKSYKAETDNLSIEEGGLKLKSTYIYEFERDIIEENNIDISDIAVDECDIIYMIDAKKSQILRYDRNSGVTKKIGCKPGVLPVSLRSPMGIAIDKDTIYIADTGNQRIIALARSNFQIRWILLEDGDGKPLHDPTDLTVGPKGNIYVLEKGKKRVLKIDRGGKIVFSIGVPELSEPTDIAVDKDGDVYILDRSVVYKFPYEKEDGKISFGEPEQIKVKDKLLRTKGLTVDATKHIFIGESPDSPSEQKTIHMIDSDDHTSALWSYRDATRRLVNDSQGNLYVISHKGSKLTFLAYTKIYRSVDEGPPKGSYISKPMDKQESKTRWHRVLLEGEFQEGSQVEFSYYITDELLTDDEIKALSEVDWRKALSDTASIQGENRRDALFQGDLQGRYLWFRIALTGDRKISPNVRSLTIFFPRIAYMEYLPATYQENPTSKDFLERFLSIFESILLEVDFTIDHLSRFFDAAGAPAEFLSWLGSWLAISIDDNWPEDRKRQLIENAISLYKKRGTRKGLEDMLGLYTDSKAFVVENFRIDRATQKKENYQTYQDRNTSGEEVEAIFLPPQDAKTTLEDGEERKTSSVLFGEERFRFCVLLTDASLSENTLNIIRKIIEDQKPAHTCYGLKVLQPWFYLDMHTYLCINTVLTEPEFVLGKTSVIGRDTTLGDGEQGGQVERHSRIGIDSKVT